MTRSLSLAVLATLFAAAPSAQTPGTTSTTTADPRANPAVPYDQAADRLGTDPTGINTATTSDNRTSNARVIENPNFGENQGVVSVGGLDRIDRDVRSLGTDSNAARYGQESTQIRRDYEALGQSPAMDAQMGVQRRYEDLDASVGASRMNGASRTDYFRMADSRLAGYDSGIEAARMRFASATGNDRSEIARDLIGLRRQRDLYRNEVYTVRGAGRSGFDEARRTAAPNLTKVDTDFRTARRESMMRGSMSAPAPGAQPMNGGTNN